ncbi:MAG: hypothetical protein KAT68_18410 [Bacteroidales bacterium]|nr:hypothetical protein [Bacteroidales bacterium]
MEEKIKSPTDDDFNKLEESSVMLDCSKEKYNEHVENTVPCATPYP